MMQLPVSKAPVPRRTRRLAFGFCALLALGACGGNTVVRGHMPDVEEIAAINPGIHTREDIVERV